VQEYTTPVWSQGLAQQGKMLNFDYLTRESIKKINSSIDESKIVVDIPQQQTDPMTGQPIQPQNAIPPMPGEEDINAMIEQAQTEYTTNQDAVNSYMSGPGEIYGRANTL
jgi:hypothetical protein